jgi:hypothetical protein
MLNYLKVFYTERHSNGRVNEKYRTDIYLDPQMKYGFYCGHCHETYNQQKKSKQTSVAKNTKTARIK